MSEFAEFVQFISFFKQLFKITESVDIDAIEEELLGIETDSRIISKVQTAVITQLVRAKRVITGPLDDMSLAAWHLYASRGFGINENPMGPSTEPGELATLESMDPSTRITILYTFCRWIAIDDGFHDKIDRLVATAKDSKNDKDYETLTLQGFRVDPVGWQGDFGVYYLLDDNRLYYMEDKEPDLSDVDPKQLPGYVEPKPAKKGEPKGKKRRGEPLTAMARKRRARAAAKRKLEQQEEVVEEEPQETPEDNIAASEEPVYVTYGEALGRGTPVDQIQWRCVCVTLGDWEAFVEKLSKSKESYDKMFHKYLKNDLLPVLREHEEKRLKDAWAREKHRGLAKLVMNRKRSSRLEEKQSQQERRMEEERRNGEEQRKRIEERRKEREERDRLATREKRLEERDRRIEQELLSAKPVNHKISAVQEVESGRSRRSSRSSSPAVGSGRSTRSSNRIKGSQAIEVSEGLRRLGPVSDHWEFDCTCGAFGDNYDDGGLAVACSRCKLWMHVKCVDEEDREILDAAFSNAKAEGVTATTQEGEFKYVCERCIRKKREEEERIEYDNAMAAHKQKLKDQAQVRKAEKDAAAALQAQITHPIITMQNPVSTVETHKKVANAEPAAVPSSAIGAAAAAADSQNDEKDKQNGQEDVLRDAQNHHVQLVGIKTETEFQMVNGGQPAPADLEIEMGSSTSIKVQNGSNSVSTLSKGDIVDSDPEVRHAIPVESTTAVSVEGGPAYAKNSENYSTVAAAGMVTGITAGITAGIHVAVIPVNGGDRVGHSVKSNLQEPPLN